jgi:hypothetical protein
MRRTLIVILTSCVVVLAVPALALGTLTEVGVPPLPTGTTGESGTSGTTGATEQPPPSCPSTPCLAISEVTGYQAKVGTDRGLVTVPRSGTIVAWTVSLGDPIPADITYFDGQEGGASEAGIAVLKNIKGLRYRLVAESPLIHLEKYFGQTAQFALARTINVTKGELVGLTVPTWAPALATTYGATTSWRASRPASQCNKFTQQNAQTTVGAIRTYACLYPTARITYTYTLVSTP